MNRFGHVHDIAHSILSCAHAQSGCGCILLSQHNAHNEPNIMHIVYVCTPVASLAGFSYCSLIASAGLLCAEVWQALTSFMAFALAWHTIVLSSLNSCELSPLCVTLA